MRLAPANPAALFQYKTIGGQYFRYRFRARDVSFEEEKKGTFEEA
jgi:hypothetical protein